MKALTISTAKRDETDVDAAAFVHGARPIRLLAAARRTDVGVATVSQLVRYTCGLPPANSRTLTGADGQILLQHIEIRNAHGHPGGTPAGTRRLDDADLKSIQCRFESDRGH